MVVVSKSSIANEWVQAETEWALEHSRPILVVGLEGFAWDDLLRVLQLSPNVDLHRIRRFDFVGDPEHEQQQLAVALDELIAKFPRRYGTIDGTVEKTWLADELSQAHRARWAQAAGKAQDGFVEAGAIRHRGCSPPHGCAPRQTNPEFQFGLAAAAACAPRRCIG